jgi:predicted DNA-binding protein with PD1-like motif
MKAKLISPGAQRTFAVIFDTGDEVVSGLTRFAEENGLAASQLTAIGAFRDLVLGYFDWEKKEYLHIPVREQVEVVSLVGDIARKGDKPQLHVHVVVAKRDGSALGGHLLEARVRPTLEVVVTESPGHLLREYDPETGLALIRL